ncbi:hypothetical protein QYE76_040744 [Lolium multiflorum]|uniref:DUF4283 domain-containing protein n=1 Tax=Lolium multiflorum TaxID=4521 RepID=A0AAD8TCG1_LOLMU|nr:hypothetical protein QYE76_040744 [Lolium multiflorum]
MAEGKEKGEASGASSFPGPVLPIEDLLKRLNLKGEDIGGLFVAKDEVASLKAGSRWMLLTLKPYSAASLKNTMKFSWAPVQGVTFRDLDQGRFLVYANCLGDWRRITEQGPWLFRDNGLMIEKFDGGCSAMSVELNRIHAWVHIHDVPELYRKQHLISGAAGNIGEVIAVDMNGYGGDFVRVRLWLDVRRKLTCFVSFKPEGEAVVVMRIKFEKIPRFRAVYGHVIVQVFEAVAFGTTVPCTPPYGPYFFSLVRIPPRYRRQQRRLAPTVGLGVGSRNREGSAMGSYDDSIAVGRVLYAGISDRPSRRILDSG